MKPGRRFWFHLGTDTDLKRAVSRYRYGTLLVYQYGAVFLHAAASHE